MNWLESNLNKYSITRYRLSKETGVSEQYLKKIIEKDIAFMELKHWQAIAISDFFKNEGVFDMLSNTTKGLLDEFKRVNSSVKVIEFEQGDPIEPVPALEDFWLKITTAHHGWLHLYINKDSKKLEWY